MYNYNNVFRFPRKLVSGRGQCRAASKLDLHCSHLPKHAKVIKGANYWDQNPPNMLDDNTFFEYNPTLPLIKNFRK